MAGGVFVALIVVVEDGGFLTRLTGFSIDFLHLGVGQLEIRVLLLLLL